MQIEDFVKVYQAKSDEELIDLAVAREQLTSEARVALQGELSRRVITVADNSETSQRDGRGRGGANVWGRLSGFSSGSVLSGPDVRTFFAFTIPLIRAICYSIGAYISAQMYHTRVSLSAGG
jgi:hypothetical protein